jgi:iron only hydrogenase large subunit-like protein
VEKYIPELIPRMIPVHSPMMCTAIYMKKYMNVTDELEYGLGSLYPMPGGLRENVEHFLGKEQIVRQVEGEHEAYHYLREYAGRIKQHKQEPFMVDIPNYSRGCIYGTATDPERNADDVMLTLAKMRNSKLEQSSGKTSKKNPAVIPPVKTWCVRFTIT